MSKGNTFENDWLKLIFHGTPIANLADNAATDPLTELWVSLHTASPGDDGDQTTSEATYGGYTRISVARSSDGWTITGNQVKPRLEILFPIASSGVETLSHWAVGTAETGTGKILHYGTIRPALDVSANKQPVLGTNTVISES